MAQQFLSDIQFGDNVYIRLGDATNGDLQIYHDGSISKIIEAGSTELQISSGGSNLYLQAVTGENGIKVIPNNAVEIYYNGSKELETNTNGVKVVNNLGIGVNPSSVYGIYQDFNSTDANIDNKFAYFIDADFSGSDNTDNDREQGGIRIDIDSSADGDASDEHRLYGIWSDVRFTGYTDLARAGYFYVENNMVTGSEQQQETVGVYASAVADGTNTNAGTNNLKAVQGQASVQNVGYVNAAYGGFFQSFLAGVRTADANNLVGVRGEVEIDSSSNITLTNARAVQAIIDVDNTTPTITNSYLLYGGYEGTTSSITNKYGIYLLGSDNINRLDGVTMFQPGTAAAPSITRVAETDTGIYFPATDTIGFTTGGSERARISNTGLGIGRAPVGKLTIEGDGGVNSNIFFQQASSQEHRIYAATNNQYNTIGSSSPNWYWGQHQSSGSPTIKMSLVGDALTAGSFVKSGGTSSQYLMADGSVSTSVSATDNTKLPLAGGTLTGQVIFPSAATTKPVLPNGFISRNDNSDTSGRHDIWGISERYYPSNSTAGDAWGIQWSGTPNDIVFVGGGTDRVTISLDEGNATFLGTVTANRASNSDHSMFFADTTGGGSGSAGFGSSSALGPFLVGNTKQDGTVRGAYGGSRMLFNAGGFKFQFSDETSGSRTFDDILTLDTSLNATFTGNVDVDGSALNVGQNNEVQILDAGSSLFPSIKVNNNGYIGSASETDTLQFQTSGDLQLKNRFGIGVDPAVSLQVAGTDLTNNVAVYIGGGFVANDAYHKEGGLLVISGTNNSQTGAGIAFQTRNTANTNYHKSSMIMDRDGAISFELGGQGTNATSEKFKITAAGAATFAGDVMPAAENAHNIGSASVRWEDLYVDDGYIRNAYIDEYIYHNGNTATYARFQTDRLTLTSGGGAIVDLHSNGGLYFTGASTFYSDITLSKASTPIIKVQDTTNNHYLFMAADDNNSFMRSDGTLLFQVGAASSTVTALNFESDGDATFGGNNININSGGGTPSLKITRNLGSGISPGVSLGFINIENSASTGSDNRAVIFEGFTDGGSANATGGGLRLYTKNASTGSNTVAITANNNNNVTLHGSTYTNTIYSNTNSAYYIDVAAGGTGLNMAGSATFGGTISSGAITSTGTSSGRYTGLEVVNTTNAAGTETAIGLGVVQASNNNCDVKLVANRVGANFGSDFYIEQTNSSGNQIETLRITEDGDATFSGKIVATASGTGIHQLKNASTNSTVLQIITTGDNPDKTLHFQSDHIYTGDTALHIQNNNQKLFLKGSQTTVGTTTTQNGYELTVSNGPGSSIYAAGDSRFAGDVQVDGNLIVTGNTTSVNVEDLNVEQGEITLNYGTGDTSAAANGSGIRIQDAVNATTDATILWDQSNSQFTFSHGAKVNNDLLIGDQTSANSTQAFGAFDQLRFDNSFSDTNRGPNKIVMHDNGGGWSGGFGIHSDTVSYYTGGYHRFYKTTSQTASTLLFESGDTTTEFHNDLEVGGVRIVHDNDSADQGTAFVRSNGDYLVLNAADSEHVYLNWDTANGGSGDVFVRRYIYAERLYDGGNTTYYVDPAGGSNLAGGITVDGNSMFDDNLRVNGWIKGASDTNTLYSSSSLGTLLQTPGNTADNNNSKIFFRDNLGNNKHSFNTNNGNATITGNVTHNGLTMTDGTDVDQIKEFSMTFQLSANAWTDTGIDGTDLATGTYIMQVFVDDFSVAGQHYDEYYSATISWFSTNTNSTAVDEIIVHRAGHAPNSGDIQFRTQRTVNADSHDLMLQVKHNLGHNAALDGTNGKTMIFKFRRLI